MQMLMEKAVFRRKEDDRSKGYGEDLDRLISAMGKRLQSEYIEGAIPYLRTHEPDLWRKLESLDGEDSIEALLEYERLFFEGLQRYMAFLDGERKAA